MTSPAAATDASPPQDNDYTRSPIAVVDRGAAVRAGGLILIVVAAAAFRFVNLHSQGLVYWDGAKFALEGVRMQGVIHSLLSGSHLVAAGKAVGTAKPSHALLIGLAYSFLGVHDSVALDVSALASLVELLFVYFLGRRLFSPVVGLMAAALLAVATYDVVYARSALSETDGNAALLGGLLIWSYARRGGATETPAVPGRTALVPVAAVVLGFALTINYRIAPSLLTIVVFDLAWTLVTRRRLLLPRVFCWLAGGALAPVAWQIAGQLSAQRGILLFRNEVTLRPETYFDQLVGRFQVGLGSGPAAGSFPWIVLIERLGPLVLGILLISVVVAARTRSSSWILVLLLVIVPFTAALSASFAVPRSLSVAIPFVALAVAACLEGIGRWSVVGRAFAVVALVIALALSGFTSWQLTGERSGFARAVAYVRSHGAKGVLTSSEVPVFYFRGHGQVCRAPRPSTVGALIADIRSGYQYAVLDYHSGGVINRILRNHGQPVARYPMLTGSGPVPDLVASEDAQHPPPAQAMSVDVYRIDGLASAGLPETTPDSCVLDRPG